MRRAWLIVLVGLGVMLQVSLLPALRPFGVVPNLVLVIVSLVALRVATSEALIAAAVGGIILDVASGVNFGLWTGVLMLVTLVAGMMHRAGIELDGSLVAPVLVAAGTITIALVIWLGMAPVVAHWPVLSLAGRLVVELMVNLGLVMVLKPLVRLLLAGSEPMLESGG